MGLSRGSGQNLFQKAREGQCRRAGTVRNRCRVADKGVCLYATWIQLRLLLRLVPMLVVMGIIFFFSHQPGNTLSLPPLPGIDKICHLAIYGVLALTVLWFLAPGRQEPPVRTALKTVLFCLVYGLSDEFHQSYIPQRSVSGFDLLADLAGAILVSVIWLNSRRLRLFMDSGYSVLAARLEGVYSDSKCKL
jgi:hypothetical protein